MRQRRRRLCKRSLWCGSAALWLLAITFAGCRIAGFIPGSFGPAGTIVTAAAASASICAFLDGSIFRNDIERRFRMGYAELQQTTATANALCDGITRMFDAIGEPVPEEVKASAATGPMLTVVSDRYRGL